MRSESTISGRRLERLSRLSDCEVDRHQRDPRGWTVVNSEGRRIGEVRDLVVDTERMTATYLDVELDTKLFNLRGEDPHVLVPVEHAHADGKRLVVEHLTPARVSELGAAREEHMRDFWNRWWNRGEPRRQPADATRITRRVTPEELNRVIEDVRPGETVRIPLVNEEIVVERRPVASDTMSREELVANRAADEPSAPRR